MFSTSLKEVPAGLRLFTTVPTAPYSDAVLTARLAYLQEMSGEFQHQGLVGSLTRRLRTATSYRQVLEWLHTIRDTALFTSTALKRLAELERKNLMEKPELVSSVVLGLLDDSNSARPHLVRNVDRTMVNDLITTPFMGYEDFSAVTPNAGLPSYAEQFTLLYRSAQRGLTSDETGVGAEGPGKEQSLGTVTAALGSYEAAVRDVVSKFKTAAIARMRVIDYVWLMRHAPSFWSAIIPPSKVAAPGAQLDTRRAGFEVLAGVAHSLLLAEPLFVAGLLQHSYASIEEWAGTIPNTFTRSFDPFKSVIHPMDVLNFTGLAGEVVKSVNKDTNPYGAKVTVMLDDLQAIPQFKLLDTAARQALESVDNIQVVTELRSLMSPSLSPVLTTTPIGSISALLTLDQLVMFGEQHATLMKSMANMLTGAPSDFLSKSTIQGINATPLPQPPACNVSYPAIPDMRAGVQPGVSDGNLSLAFGRPAVNAFTERALQQNFLLTFAVADTLLDAFQAEAIPNRDLARRLAPSVGHETWQALYPCSIAKPGARVFSINELNSSDAIISAIAALTGRSFHQALTGLNHWEFRQAVATSQSSWLQLIELGGKKTAYSVNTGQGEGFVQIDANAKVIDPEGAPYGMPPQEWAWLFGRAEGIELIKGVLAARVIKIPAYPGNEMVGAQLTNTRYYHYFKGRPAAKVAEPSIMSALREAVPQQARDREQVSVDGRSLQLTQLHPGKQANIITYLAQDESMLHYTLMPHPTYAPGPAVMFDARYAYSTKDVVASIRPSATLKTRGGSDQPVASKKLTWQNAQDSVVTEVYGTGAETAVSPIKVEAAIDPTRTARTKQALEQLKEATDKSQLRTKALRDSHDRGERKIEEAIVKGVETPGISK